MNIFIIPSWYPSPTHPFTGVFFKEQAEALAQFYTSSNLAISTWGSHNEELLLWGKDPLKSILKLAQFSSVQPFEKKIADNLTEYFSPALTWSRKVLQGNIKSIIKINENHFLSFQAKAGPVNIIHAHSAYPAGWVAMILAKKYKIPYLITEHMGPFPFKDFLLKSGRLSPYLAKPFQQSFATIAVSPQQKKTLEQWEIPRVHYIPNLVNETLFHPLADRRQEPEPFTFFSLAKLAPEKGIADLLKAIKLLGDKDFLFRIGGDGQYKHQYQALAQQMGISDKIEWLGFLSREKAAKEFQNCHVFVLPSLYEAMGVVYAEAIACGKPVIGTRCGGPESIINASNGLLVEPGNADALAGALMHMYNNHHTYNATEIREDFCSKYSRPVVCRQLMDIYMEAIQ